jgi:hypothetical protein
LCGSSRWSEGEAVLTPEQVKALRDQRNYMSDEARRVNAAGELPEPLRSIAYGLLFRDAEGNRLPSSYDRQAERTAAQQRALAQLDTLAPGGRTAIFRAFFPSVAEAIELGWQYLHDAPYLRVTNYHYQEFFRAPNRPDVTLRARGQWLLGLLGNIAPQDDPAWLAQHAAYLDRGGDQFGLLFAAVIERDSARGQEVFNVLIRSARGEDEIGAFGRHIPIALLATSRPDGWACVERLLLGAQREEGVRQTILEALAVACPAAMRHMLGVILDQQLVRFSAVTRAVNGWLGTAWDSDQASQVTRALRGLLAALGEPGARALAVARGSGEEVYLALWATACEDVYAALPLAERLLDDADAGRRYAAARLLAGAHIPEALPLLAHVLDDADPRIIARACAGLRIDGAQFAALANDQRIAWLNRDADGVFERIEALLARLPRQTPPAQPLHWNAPVPLLDREQVADLLLAYLGESDPKRLLPHIAHMSQYGRIQAAQRLAESGLADAASRAALLDQLKDRASVVRGRALKLLLQTPIQEDEARTLESFLDRPSMETRQGALQLLLKQENGPALASVERLLEASNERRRLAGLELLRLLHEARRTPEECRAQAENYRDRRRELTTAEEVLLAPVLEGDQAAPTLDDALGLARPDQLTPPTAPQAHARLWTTPAAVACLRALDDLIHELRAESYTYENRMGREEVLLGEANPWRFPQPDARLSLEKDAARLPFASVWRDWAKTRDAALRDEDGLEALRMLIQLYQGGADEKRALLAMLSQEDTSRYEVKEPRLTARYPVLLLEKLCWWLIRLYPPTGGADFLLDHLETELTLIPEHALHPSDGPTPVYYREYQRFQQAVTLVRAYNSLRPNDWTGAHDGRFWRLLCWSVTLPQMHLLYYPQTREALAAHYAGAASAADLIYQFLGPRVERIYGRTTFDELRTFSARKPHALLAEYPIAGEVYERCMRRVLEVELRRGETPTAATDAALSLRSLTGVETFLAILRALGDERLARGYSYGERSKTYTLSHLLRATFPGAHDTPDAFSVRVHETGASQRRLVEAAVYAPQWARHIERALGWEGFADGVWWVHAHTKDRQWGVDRAIRDEWETAISAWTPLSSADLFDGAVDVAWFRSVLATLGEERWEALYQAALYASGGAGHARARLFADALLGRVEAAPLMERISAKRNRDAACALGLLALPATESARRKALLARYQTLQDFMRSAQKLGVQRREGDQKAAHIGLENLARTAGYADPARFQWAMELDEVADLAAGPLRVTRDGVQLALEVNAFGQPRLRVEKAGKALKDIPPRLKKDPEVVALRERKRRLEEQSARMRAGLERAMLREERFTARELIALLRHPLLAPLLEQLVFIGPDAMGYLVGAGTALRAPCGDEALNPEVALRIAHPYDLYASSEWSEYQRECFAAERIQPFKQVFRELYPLTEAERIQLAGARSLRYAGQQLQPRQAMALLAGRGWITSAQEGNATRTFHERGVTVAIDFLFGGGTPVDVEGLTLEGVTFCRAGNSWSEPLPLVDIPPILFSEVMRDLDLVVSVAHRGGIDPEGSASTIEMRAALVREVCAALRLANVKLQSAHAIITGALGEYSIHLGSGVIHRLPGGSVCIIPVGAQHRGRIFLPFADDDPKTAEIVSKILLLARDSEIKDPLILDQLYARV